MPQRSLTVGTVQVTAVCDVTGDFPAPLDQAFPGVEATAWAPWRRPLPGAAAGGPPPACPARNCAGLHGHRGCWVMPRR